MSQTQDQQLSEVELELVQGGAEGIAMGTAGALQGVGTAMAAPFAALGSGKSKG